MGPQIVKGTITTGQQAYNLVHINLKIEIKCLIGYKSFEHE